MSNLGLICLKFQKWVHSLALLPWASTDFQRKIGRPIVLSDAAHSIGSLIDGVPTPLFSDFSVFSFHSVKNITTGEGGAITFKIFDEVQDGLILKELRLLSSILDSIAKAP